jgi:hypothetical protein
MNTLLKFFISIPITLFMYYVTTNFVLSYSDNDLIFSLEERPFTKTFSEWANWWWNKHLSIPDIKNNKELSHPRDEYSQDKCNWAQDGGPVWFLPDGKESSDITKPEIRKCVIPEGKAVMVQIVGSGCSIGEGFKDLNELMDCAVWVLPKAEFTASIDGIEVMNTQKDPSDRDKHYVIPFETNLTYVKDNYYKVPEGTYLGTVAGYFILTKPLSAGNHTIQFQESAIEFLEGFPKDKRQSHVLYEIEVKKL